MHRLWKPLCGTDQHFFTIDIFMDLVILGEIYIYIYVTFTGPHYEALSYNYIIDKNILTNNIKTCANNICYFCIF